MKYTESLIALGLTADQAKIYEVLLGFSLAPARVIAQKAGVGRELTYVVLAQLEQLHLVERSTQGKIILFKACHPRSIQQLLDQKKQSVLQAERAYQETVATMVTDFNIAHHKPYVQFYEGLEGLQKTYNDIIASAKKVYVIRSLYDYENPLLRSMVTEQIKRQATNNIRSYVLSPQLAHMGKERLSHDTERNITRKVVSKEKFSFPSQVLIYNNTVSITAIREEVITTVIENEDIAKTFLTLFNYMWDAE